ncbi:MAG: methanogenesis marker 16 metalloprotein [Promethearchaeota archaeon]
MQERSLEEINKKISNGSANVFTMQEIVDAFKNGNKLSFKDVDVVTTATKALMSGILGVFSLRLSPPKTLRKFTEVSLNGIPAYPGPCPNEFLGIADFLVYGTGQSKTRENYAGGSLFRDLVEGNLIDVVAKSSEGEIIKKQITLDDMQYARMMGTRQAIKNYNAMINPTKDAVDTIFSVLPFQPNNQEITFSGCGALNPFQNDQKFESIGEGSPVLVNGNRGILIGPGTRNYIGKPNMMTIADFKGMNPEYMGGFKTSYGLEPICSIAVPIPILNERVFSNIMKSDKDVPLTILNLVGREKLGETTYGQVWDDNFLVKFDPSKCDSCKECKGEQFCPTDAFHKKKGIDRSRCFNCGLCAITCTASENAFDVDLKTVDFNGKNVPIVLRQSDRHGAIRLATKLKKMILNEEFKLVKPVGKLVFADMVK